MSAPWGSAIPCMAVEGVAVHANGYDIVALKPSQKIPAHPRWQTYRTSAWSVAQFTDYAARYRKGGVGLLCDKIVAIDIDESDPLANARLVEVVHAVLGLTSAVRIGRAPRRVMLYRAVGPISSRKVGSVDLLGHGRQVVGFGLHPDTRAPYAWPDASPITLHVDRLPEVGSAQIDELAAALRSAQGMPQAALAEITSSSNGLIVDGREGVAAQQVYRAWAEGCDDIETIARVAFKRFGGLVDLSIPRGNGSGAWCLGEFRQKAGELLRRGKPRPAPRHFPEPTRSALGEWDRVAFSARVNEAGALGRLAPADIAVSHAMLQYAQTGEGCFATPSTIAKLTNLVARSVKRSRARLVSAGYWRREGRASAKGYRIHYHPVLNGRSLIVPALDTRIVRRVGGSHFDASHALTKPPESEKKNGIKQLSSLEASPTCRKERRRG